MKPFCNEGHHESGTVESDLTNPGPSPCRRGNRASLGRRHPAQTRLLELFDRILSHEVEVREARRRATALKLSGLPGGMTLETFDFAFQPDIDRDRVDGLATGEFIRNHENVLFFGPPGVGKTHLAVALGVRAVELGYSVYDATMDDLMTRLKKRAHLPVASIAVSRI